jgi:hypothetical protein
MIAPLTGAVPDVVTRLPACLLDIDLLGRAVLPVTFYVLRFHGCAPSMIRKHIQSPCRSRQFGRTVGHPRLRRVRARSGESAQIDMHVRLTAHVLRRG